MRKNHHSVFLAAAIVIALAACIGSTSEARALRPSSASTIRVLKPGAGINSGEPDDGGGRTHNNGGVGGGFIPSPTGFGFLVPVWITRIIGGGW